MTRTFDAKATIDIAAPIETVWNGITDPVTISRYMMGAKVRTDWGVGHAITWSGEMNGKPYEDKGEILAVEQPSRLQMSHWSPLSGVEDSPEHYHIVTYDLESTAAGTTLRLTQTNNPTPDAANEMAAKGWTPMLETLKEILER